MHDNKDLPEEVLAVIGAPERADREALAELAQHIGKLRDEAVDDRRLSGIEKAWKEAEEAYIGIDDENRVEFQGAKWVKPMTMDGPLVRRTNSSDGVRATAFIKETARYVDAGTAKVCEIALPVDGKPFTLKATPVPEMSALAENNTPASAITGRPMPKPDGSGEATVGDLAKNQIKLAEDKAERAAQQIYDWMVEYKHPAELRKVIFDGARIGTGVLMGPIPETSRAMVVRKQQPAGGMLATAGAAKRSTYSVEMVQKIKPVARWLDPWRFFPAAGCGEDVHNGGHCFVVDSLLPTQLSDLKDDPAGMYLPDAIDKVLTEGPSAALAEAELPDDKQDRNAKVKHFEVWHFYGKVPRRAFEAANAKQADELEDMRNQVFCIVTVVNDTVIRAVLPALDTERLPFHVFNWRRRPGSWAGVGVAEQVRTPQRMLNAAWRRLLNNAGQSSGAQVVVDQNSVVPANGEWKLTPDKLWWLLPGASIDDVRKAFASFQWPSTTQQLLSMIEAIYRLFEEHASIPLITQGQSGDTTPDTFSGQQLQDNNANQLLRDVGFGLNDTVTTTLVDMMYEWLLLDPEVPDDMKGDYKVDTSGALAIIEKALQDQSIMAMGTMIANPAFRIDPAKWFAEWARSKRLVPSNFQYSDAEWERISQQPPPKAPQVQAAEIRAQAQVQVAQSRDQLAAEKIRVDTDRDTKNVQAQTARTLMERDAQNQELAIRYQLAVLDYANKRGIELDKAKVELAKLTMELNLQRELAGADGKGPQVAEPKIEPEGRAPEGEAFQA